MFLVCIVVSFIVMREVGLSRYYYKENNGVYKLTRKFKPVFLWVVSFGLTSLVLYSAIEKLYGRMMSFDKSSPEMRTLLFSSIGFLVLWLGLEAFGEYVSKKRCRTVLKYIDRNNNLQKASQKYHSDYLAPVMARGRINEKYEKVVKSR